MNLFKQKPSARENFLVAALAAVGVTEQDIAAKLAANETNFLADAIAANDKAEAQLARLTEAYGAYSAAFDAVGINVDTDVPRTDALKAHIADREAKARAEGERAAGLKVAEELAARGVPAVPVAAAAAADAPKKPGDGLNGLQKVQAIIAAQISTQNQANQ